MSRRLHSSPDPTASRKSEPHPWLEEQVYARKRERTVRLVKRSVDALKKDKQRVSLATIAARSKELDPEHRGISESAILDNPEARAYYEQHRSWQGAPKLRAKPMNVAWAAPSRGVKPGRDEQRVRQRYLRMSKETVVERLIVTERTLAQQRERWLSQQDEVLTWRLRAEAALAQLQEVREHSPKRKK